MKNFRLLLLLIVLLFPSISHAAYDPTEGRWLSRDPIGEEGGINLYDYVHNRPIDTIDPLGLDDLNLFPKSPIQTNANNTPSPPNTFVVGGHGNPNGTVTPGGTPITPDQMAQMIKSNPAYKPGEPVRLDSCNTGTGKYAQQVANALNAPVTAPNNIVWIYPDGHTVVAPPKNGQLNQGPDLTNPGKYVPFSPTPPTPAPPAPKSP